MLHSVVKAELLTHAPLNSTASSHGRPLITSSRHRKSFSMTDTGVAKFFHRCHYQMSTEALSSKSWELLSTATCQQEHPTCYQWQCAGSTVCTACPSSTIMAWTTQCLQTVFRAVVVSRLTYVSPAWRGFITSADIQKVAAIVCGHYCPVDLPDFEALMDESDERLFHTILYNPHHTLHALLPRKSEVSHNYQLRQRVHDRLLPQHQGHLTGKNFINRLLYKDIY